MAVFNLKKEWFNKFKDGTKTTEYREFKPYWNKRIAKLKTGDFIILACGYPAYMDSSKMLCAEIIEIDLLKSGKNTDLKIDKPVWAIKLRVTENEVR